MSFSLTELHKIQNEVNKSILQQYILNTLWASAAIICANSGKSKKELLHDEISGAMNDIGLVLGLNDDGGWWYFSDKIYPQFNK